MVFVYPLLVVLKEKVQLEPTQARTETENFISDLHSIL